MQQTIARCGQPFAAAVCFQTALCDEGRAPKAITTPEFTGRYFHGTGRYCYGAGCYGAGRYFYGAGRYFRGAGRYLWRALRRN